MSDDYELVDDEEEPDPNDQEQELQDKAIGEWSEIPLNSMTESDSTTSSYSQRSDQNDGREANNEASGSNEKELKDDEKKQSGTGFSEWISKSSFRRQSLEDVFAQSTLFGKFGRSTERRNSESEVETSTTSVKKEFFLFGRQEGLTDSQIENLFLPPEHL